MRERGYEGENAGVDTRKSGGIEQQAHSSQSYGILSPAEPLSPDLESCPAFARYIWLGESSGVMWDCRCGENVGQHQIVSALGLEYLSSCSPTALLAWYPRSPTSILAASPEHVKLSARLPSLRARYSDQPLTNAHHAPNISQQQQQQNKTNSRASEAQAGFGE
eukprot:668490-Rhodomonas_salina.9